ncbi:MAG: hypothetical protein LBM02_05930 [Lachnospiraceae bacterium]|jgi:5-methylcytosine-specific restriction endonuclease McrBC regulatory subunit McrC|nr:hypothetical protein [Lachnospiraceae bacterium]
MKLMRVKDNSSILKEEFEPVKNLVKKISDKTLEELEKENLFVFPELLKNSDDIIKDQMILQSVNSKYILSNVMGFLGYGNERLDITSRFDESRQDFFLQYLLGKVMDMPNIVELNTNVNSENRLLNLLIFLFPYYLKLAMRKGSYKTYIYNEYNDENIKGTIDVSRHIKINTPFVGNIAYKKREFSYDNYVMELVRHTIEFIRHKPYGQNLLQKVKDEVSSVILATNNYASYNKNKIIQLNKKKPLSHAYYHEYRSLQRICILILKEEKYQIGLGTNQLYGILFDGAWLWEEYVNSLIKNRFYHPMNKGRQGAQRLFSTNSSKVGLIYPDFISKDIKNRIIVDAKYKPISNIGNKDYLQVLAYMFRFNSKKGMYLYPEKSDEDDLILKLNKGTTYENNVSVNDDITIIKCGLKIPNEANSYEDFVVKIKESENQFISRLLHSYY